jgi:putative ABC transport system permease protein
MEIRPILSTLHRHKTAASLIVIEVALTCAIICNAVFLIALRLERIEAPTGMADAEVLSVHVTGIGKGADPDAVTRQDLQTLRALPGVKSATITNMVPFGHEISESGLNLTPDQASPTLDAATYMAAAGFIDSFGLRLVEGRDFNPDEYQDQSALEHSTEVRVPAAILSRATAQRLFPGKSAVGQAIYVFGAAPIRVVGVVERLIPPQPGMGNAEGHALLVPVRPTYNQGNYVLRVDPARRDELLKAAVAALGQVDTRRIVTEQSRLADMRSDYYQQDRATAWLLVAVCIALLVVTAFGIVGLASFWVQQRTRMIGTRRALGASRGHILRYFQTENFLLTSIGIVLGMVGAYAINELLMTHYELPRLPWAYLPFGALVLWLLGQLAVLAPALRAAALPPMVVMRAG